MNQKTLEKQGAERKALFMDDGNVEAISSTVALLLCRHEGKLFKGGDCRVSTVSIWLCLLSLTPLFFNCESYAHFDAQANCILCCKAQSLPWPDCYSDGAGVRRTYTINGVIMRMWITYITKIRHLQAMMIALLWHFPLLLLLLHPVCLSILTLTFAHFSSNSFPVYVDQVSVHVEKGGYEV